MSIIVTVLAWLAAAWIVVGALFSIALIGKPRKPITPGVAIAGLLISSAVALLLVMPR